MTRSLEFSVCKSLSLPPSLSYATILEYSGFRVRVLSWTHSHNNGDIITAILTFTDIYVTSVCLSVSLSGCPSLSLSHTVSLSNIYNNGRQNNGHTHVHKILILK